MSDRSDAHKIAADVLASQHMRADRTVQDLAPLAREFLRLSAANNLTMADLADRKVARTPILHPSDHWGPIPESVPVADERWWKAVVVNG